MTIFQYSIIIKDIIIIFDFALVWYRHGAFFPIKVDTQGPFMSLYCSQWCVSLWSGHVSNMSMHRMR